jgi:mono/diheme cytochrome c family protein
MRLRILGGTLLAVWAVTAGSAMSASERQAPVAAATPGAAAAAPTSVLEGVYTEEQAKRGEAIYSQTCANCHGATLGGGEMAPALAGPDFIPGWVKQSVNDLFVRVHEDMPQDNPGTLTPEQAADTVSFILASNKWPAGQTELSKDKDVLKNIKIEAPKP